MNPPRPLRSSDCEGASFDLTLDRDFLALPDNNTRIPPDTMGAVGPHHVMTMLNTEVRIQDKTGQTIDTMSIFAFWSPLDGNPFDPRLLYDPLSDRWIAACDADPFATSSSVFFAISASSDPTGEWSFYQFPADSTGQTWADFPGFGANSTWIAITNNMFTISGNFRGVKMWVIDKQSALLGGPLIVSVFAPGFDQGGFNTDGFSMQPCLTFDEDEPALYLVDNSGWFDDIACRFFIRLSQITGTGDQPVWSVVPGSSEPDTGFFAVEHNFSFFQIDAVQRGSDVRVETNDPRIGNAVFRNGHIWFTHPGGMPGGPSLCNNEVVDRTASFWYQIDPGAMPDPIVQSGVIEAGPGTHHFFPSIAVNCADDACVGFSRSDAGRFIETAYAVRRAADPLGAISAPETIKPGEDSYEKDFGSGRVRWGDYSATVVDPVDDLTFWTIQQYAALDTGEGPNDDRWGTWWGRIATERDCNGNGMPDTQDIDEGRSSDCNANDIPDECDVTTLLDFASPRQVLTGRGAFDIGAADLDIDQAIDLVVVNQEDDTLVVLLNDTAGNFPDPAAYPTGASPLALQLADFNGSGAPDVAVVNMLSDDVAIYGNFGLGTLTGPEFFAVGNAPLDLAAADFDADGDTDIAVANFDDDSVSILLNNGSGTFATSSVLPAGDGPAGIAAADVDADTLPDLLVAALNADQVWLLRNLGQAVFASPQIIDDVGDGPRHIRAADIDHDGDADALVTLFFEDRLAWLENDGTGEFASPRRFATGQGPFDLAVADLDRDLLPDCIVGNSVSMDLTVLLNEGATFAEPATLPGVDPRGIAAADLDSDGDIDLAVADPAREAAMILANQTVRTSTDCNANGVPDECDIADGSAADCNANGLPDACDLDAGLSADCNGNARPDECDIADGTSQDADGDGIPDECQTPCDPPDLDCDGDVDIVDFTTFAGCFSGSGTPPPPGCDPADFDADGDVDIVDFTTFAGAFTGSR